MATYDKYNTIYGKDGSRTFYNKEQWEKHIAAPECAEHECEGHVWYQNGYSDDAFAEKFRQFCFTCAFWNRVHEEDAGAKKDQAVIAEVDVVCVHYYLPEDRLIKPPDYKGFLGFGGRYWAIKFYDGRTVNTNDLWMQGDIPVHFRDRFPPNATLRSLPPIKLDPSSLAEDGDLLSLKEYEV